MPLVPDGPVQRGDDRAFPLFGLGVSHVPYSTVYLWTLAALAIGCLATYALTWTLQRWRR